MCYNQVMEQIILYTSLFKECHKAMICLVL